MIKKYFFLFSFALYSQLVVGQNTYFTTTQIDSIVKQIDATCISGGITDYIFHKKGKKKRVIGGGADWFYTDSSGTALLKAVREVSVNFENIDTYYFYQDTLIYLKTLNNIYADDKKKVNWQGQYYFNNGTLIFKQDDLKFVFNAQRHLETARQFFGNGKIWKKHR